MDHELVMFNFREVFKTEPRRALYALQAVLLDEATCRARVEMIRHLRKAADDARNVEPAKLDLSVEVQAIAKFGMFRAIDEGRVPAERVILIAFDPDTLWQAHLAVSETS